MGNHPCEKFPQENYNREDILHSNRRRSKSRMVLEEEYIHILKNEIYLKFIQVRLE